MTDPVSTGLQGGADRIRETGKWLTISLAALGSVLIAGTQLSDVGSIDTGTDRFCVVVAGGIAGAIGAALILAAACWVMTTPAQSLNALATKAPWGTREVLSDPTLLDGYADVGAVKEEYVTAAAQRKDAYSAYYRQPEDGALKAAAEVADARAVTINDITHELLGVVSYANLAFRWRIAQGIIVVGAAIAAAGIAMYVWGANPPADAKASAAAPRVLTTPAVVSVQLTSAGSKALQSTAGPRCVQQKRIKALVLAKTAAGPDLLIQGTSLCRATRLILTTGWGAVRE